MYINGALNDTESSFTKALANTPEQIAIGWSGQGDQYWDGRIDEVRLSNTIRSAQWIATEYANQNSPSTFYSVGSQVSSSCIGSGPYYVQSKSQSYSSVSQGQITLPGSTGSGNLLVLSLAFAPQSLSVSSVTDPVNGNAYNLALAPTNIGASGKISTYYVNNSLGGGPITATVSLSGSATTLNVSFLEYGGIAMASPKDQDSSGASSGTAMDSGSKTISQAIELIYGFGAGDYACHHTGSTFIEREVANGRCALDRVVSSTGSYSVTATQSTSGNWALQMVTFRGA